MAEPSHGPASFCTQANALLRKNLTFQKRNVKANIRLISSPLILCVLLVVMQMLYNTIEHPSEQSDSKKCIPENAGRCPMKKPPKYPPTLQVPASEYLAVRTNSIPFADLPDNSCRSHRSCPATMLFTGGNQTLGQILARNMLPSSFTLNTSNVLGSLANNVLGSYPGAGDRYIIQTQCSPNSTSDVQVQLSPDKPQDTRSLSCIQGLSLWRNSTKAINDELYKGYFKGNQERKINEIVAGYDFSNTDTNKYNVSIWFNSSSLDESYSDDGDIQEWLRVPRSINLASNAYLKFLRGPGTKILFEYVKEMPKAEQKIDIIAYFLGPLFFTWVVIQLFPVILTALVYEKQQKLRIMMKMHGLGDGPYWLISYTYFLVVSALYMLCFVIFGSAIDLKIFRLHDYSVQFVFYFVFINLQIAVAFLAAVFFSNVKSATVVGYIIVFGSGLVGKALFESFLEKTSFSSARLIAMELYPGFSLYRGLYEFNQSLKLGTHGIRWKDLSDSSNGIAEVLIVMAVEWILVLSLAYYADKVVSSGRGPLFFLEKFCRRIKFRKPSLRRQESKVSIPMENPDVIRERERVEELIAESSTSCSIISDDLKKVYPGRDGNPEKFAVRGLSLAIPRGECFGMLGPNGAGKTSVISMMIGLTKPTSGTAYIEGMDIRTQMDKIYTSMGVCPQHDLLWETLTGREHLLFYGRLKSLKGQALQQAVEESLKGVNLYYGGVADKQAGKYSGGMKRRLSVAISLIGDPKVVYMDEPSTGLDPASRNKLWNVVKRAKPDRAIILTTHSMEEAEVLCDRLGIFVNGSLQCIGNSRELKGRYGGSYVFTITTSSAHEEEVENLVKRLSPSAKRIYQISGTQKFEIPKQEVRISEVFEAVEYAKSRFTVYAWGLADTTLEDVFIKVARGAQAANVPS